MAVASPCFLHTPRSGKRFAAIGAQWSGSIAGHMSACWRRVGDREYRDRCQRSRNKWRSLRWCRDSVVEIESGVILVRRRIFKRAERLIQVIAIQRDAPTPTRIEGLREEYAVACANNRLL